MAETREVNDSLGPMQVPQAALYQAQTQRASNNFPYGSDHTMPASFLRALALLKASCATANEGLGLLPSDIAEAIKSSAAEIHVGQYYFLSSCFY